MFELLLQAESSQLTIVQWIAIIESTMSLGFVLAIYRMWILDRRTTATNHKVEMDALNLVLDRLVKEQERTDKRLEKCEEARDTFRSELAELQSYHKTKE